MFRPLLMLAMTACALIPLAARAHDDPPCKPGIQMDEAMIPSDTPGIQLYVHGATYPSETAFDLELDGQSWMANRKFNRLF